MNFWEMKRQCQNARKHPLNKNDDGKDICCVQHTLVCEADSCPSRHYWSNGKQRQIGWYSSRALENTELLEQFEEEMMEGK